MDGIFPDCSFRIVRRSLLSSLFYGLVNVLLAIGLLLGLAACDWTTEPFEQESLVVEAFVETGRPLPTVILRQTRPLQVSNEGLRDAASNGQVVLYLDGRRIPYRESSETPGQYIPESDSLVAAQVPWRLTARWNGETARADGRTPSPIRISEICLDVPESPSEAVQVDSLRRDSLDIPADQGFIYPIEVTVRWPSDLATPGGDTTNWVRGQLRPDATPPSGFVEFFLEPADIRREDAFSSWGAGREWKGVYAVPVDSDTARLPPHDLTTALVRGDSAFAAFAQSRTDPDRREPISNVDGGLGVALAVATDSLAKVVTDSLAHQDAEQCWTSPESSSGNPRGEGGVEIK